MRITVISWYRRTKAIAKTLLFRVVRLVSNTMFEFLQHSNIEGRNPKRRARMNAARRNLRNDEEYFRIERKR